MVNRRISRIVGASRSNSHQSRNQSMNHRQPISASFYPGGQNVAGEGTSGPSLEERIRKMEESHNEILQLLRETRQSALPQREEVLLPRDPPGIEEVQPEHLQAEIHLPPPRRHRRSLQDNELADTASSTHPSQTGQQHLIPPDLHEDLAQPYVAELPRDTLCLIREIRNPYCISITGRSIPGGFDPTSSTQTSARRWTFVRIILDAELPPVAGLQRRWTFASQTSAPSPDFHLPSTRRVKLSVSKIQTQRHQIRLNPSPNESKSRTRSAVGRFKPQFELPNGFQIGRAYSRIERLDETNPTSPRSLNSDIIKTSKCPSNEPSFLQEGGPRGREERRKRGEEEEEERRGGREEKKKRREEGKEGRNSSSTTAGFPSDAGILSEFQERPKLYPTPK
ncbi:hypothetical protein M5K25_025107 [Dendrobium thyrsiflorum]|uniref:Uncharacterized protein n=1 Tax=Dendrobium thyrsiflorum TaxID=117978 RepID=A0ABD0U3M9_DENTH